MPTVVVTLSDRALDGLDALLAGFDVEVRRRPLLEFRPPASWAPLDAALGALGRYAGLAVTSPRAAEAVAARLALASPAVRRQALAATAWVAGPRTAEPLRGQVGTCLAADGANDDDGAAGAVARAIVAARPEGPVLFPSGDRRRDVLPALLAEAGIAVEEVPAYRSLLADDATARAALAGADAVVVGSPSVARLLAHACPVHARPELVAIGPTTAAAASGEGWPPAAVAERPSADALAHRVCALLLAY